jgi:hypothetical protein
MNEYHHLALADAHGLRRGPIVHLVHVLHLEKVIPAAQRA